MIDQTRHTDSPTFEPEIAADAPVLQQTADAALARAIQRKSLRATFESFCRRPADIDVLEFLVMNDRLELESAYGVYEKVEAMHVNLADAVYVMGLLTPEEHADLEALYPEDTPEERLGCALRINKDADDYAGLGLAQRMVDEEFALPAWIATAAESFSLILDEIERSGEESEIVLHSTAPVVHLTEHGDATALPFFGGWWEWVPDEPAIAEAETSEGERQVWTITGIGDDGVVAGEWIPEEVS